MAVSVLLKRTSVSGRTPTTASLALGELALNTFDGRVFFKKNAGSGDVLLELATQTWVTGQGYATVANLNTAIPAGTAGQLLGATGTAGSAAAVALGNNFSTSGGTLTLVGVAQTLTVAISGASQNLTATQIGASNTIIFTGALSVNSTVSLPASTSGRWVFVNNCTQLASTNTPLTVSVKITGGSSPVVIPQGASIELSANGSTTTLTPAASGFVSPIMSAQTLVFAGNVGPSGATTTAFVQKTSISGFINFDDEFGHSGAFNIRNNSDTMVYGGASHFALSDVVMNTGQSATETTTITTSDVNSVTVPYISPAVVVSTNAPVTMVDTNNFIPKGSVVTGITYPNASGSPTTTATGTVGQNTLVTAATLSSGYVGSLLKCATANVIAAGTYIKSIVGTTVTLSQPLLLSITAVSITVINATVTFAPPASSAPTGSITFTTPMNGPRIAGKAQIISLGQPADQYSPVSGSQNLGQMNYQGLGHHITATPSTAPNTTSAGEGFAGLDLFLTASSGHHAQTGREIDNLVLWGGSVSRLAGVNLVRGGTHTTRGVFWDAGFNITGSGDLGCTPLTAYELGGSVGGWPLGPDSTILGSHEQIYGVTARQTLWAGYGIDFGNNTFSFDAWRSPNARIDGSGDAAFSSVTASQVQADRVGVGSIAALTLSGGTGYGAVPTVVIQAPASGGTQAAATISAMGLSGVRIVNGGSGYSANQVISVGSGGGSVKVLTVDGSGKVLSLTVNAAGSYSSIPSNPVSLNVTGTGLSVMCNYAPLTASMGTAGAGYSPSSQVFLATMYGLTASTSLTSGYVSAVTLSGGAGFTSWPLAWIAPPASGVQAQAQVLFVGATSFTRLTGGSGFTTGDYVVCQHGVTFNVTASGGVVTGATLVNTNSPAVNGWSSTSGSGRIPQSNWHNQVFTTRGANALGKLIISGVNSGYTTDGTYPLVIVGTCTTKAKGFYVVSGGSVTAAWITDGGAGYAAAPSVTAPFGGTPGSTNYATITPSVVAGQNLQFIITGVTPVQVAVTNPGSGYGSAPGIYFSDGYGVSSSLTLGNTQVSKLSNSGELLTVANGGGVSGALRSSLIGAGTGTVRLTADGAAANATNVQPIAAHHMLVANLIVTARNTANDDVAVWITTVIARNTSGTTVAVLEPTAATMLPAYSTGTTLNACTLAITGDTANGGLNITISNIGAVTVTAQASLHGQMN